MERPIGTNAQQVGLRNVVALLTIANNNTNDAIGISRYIDGMLPGDINMALAIAIGMLHSAIEDRAALTGHTVADYLRLAGITAAAQGRE